MQSGREEAAGEVLAAIGDSPFKVEIVKAAMEMIHSLEERKREWGLDWKGRLREVKRKIASELERLRWGDIREEEEKHKGGRKIEYLIE